MRILTLIVALLLTTPAWAKAPVSYKPLANERLREVAIKHGVSLRDLNRANPNGPDGQGWLLLPSKARLPSEPAVAIIASARQEVAEIIKTMRVDGVYRIVGREFFVGEWEGGPIVTGGAGGNQSNAAIGATLLLENFNVKAMGFVGIAGGGPTTQVGDALVASGALPHDNGNWYDFAMPGGGIFAGLTWNARGGPPIITDAGRRSQLVLFPDPTMMACIRKELRDLELPPIGQDVADFHGQERYRPGVLLDGWSASGAQFITSHHMRDTYERRIALEAARLGIPAPASFVVDQEDFGAVLAAEEQGVPWFVVRVVVDLAAQKSPGAGLPLALYDTPEKIPEWLAAHGQQSYARNIDYSYFYRQVEIVTRPIMRTLSAGCAAPSLSKTRTLP